MQKIKTNKRFKELVLKQKIKKNKKINILLIFKNFIRDFFKNKIFLFLMIFLISITSFIFMFETVTIKRLENSKNITFEKSNLHDFVIDFNDSIIFGKKDSKYSNYYINQRSIENISNLNNDNNFNWNFFSTRSFTLDDGNNSKTLKLVTNFKDSKIDKVLITKGYNIGQNKNDSTLALRQVILDPGFAKINNIKLNSIIRIQKDDQGSSIIVNSKIIKPGYNWFKVVGFGVSAAFTTPLINKSILIPNKSKEGIIYVNPSIFGFSKKYATGNNDGNNYYKYNQADDKIRVLSTYDNEDFFVGKFLKNSKKNTNLINSYLSNSSLPYIKTKIQELKKVSIWKNIFKELKDIHIKDPNIQKGNIYNEQILKKDIKNKIYDIFKKNNALNYYSNYWNINLYDKLYDKKTNQSNYQTSNYLDPNNLEHNKLTYYVISSDLISSNLEEPKEKDLLENNNLGLSKNMEALFKVKIDNNGSKDFKLKNKFNNQDNNIKELGFKYLNSYLKPNDKSIIISNNYIVLGNSSIFKKIKVQIIENIINSIKDQQPSILEQINNYLNNNLSMQFELSKKVKKNSSIFLNTLLSEEKVKLKGTFTLYNYQENQTSDTIIKDNINIEIQDNNFWYFHSSNSNSNQFVYGLYDKNYDFYGRTNSFSMELKIFKVFIFLVMLILFAITGIILFLITKKNISYMHNQIAILKSEGYRNYHIMFSLLAIPVLILSFSIILIFPFIFFSQLIANNVIERIASVYLAKINYAYIFLMFILIFLIFSAFLFLIILISGYFLVSKPPLKILYKKDKLTPLWIIKLIKKPYKKAHFNTRLQISILSQSIGKLLVVSLTIFISGILLSLSVIGPQLMINNKNELVAGKKFNTEVHYNSPIWNSPYSFYKTYNSGLSNYYNIPKIGTDFKDIFNNQDNMSSSVYCLDPTNNPLFNALKLVNLQYRNISLNFLKQFNDNFDKSMLLPYNMTKTAWNEYENLNKALNDSINYIDNKSLDEKLLKDSYNNYRNFYLSFKNTINLTISPFLKFTNTINNTSINSLDFSKMYDLLKEKANKSGYELPDAIKNFQKISKFFDDNPKNFVNNKMQILNDKNFIQYSYKDLLRKYHDGLKQAINFTKQMNTIFISCYWERFPQLILQRLYSEMPSSIKTILLDKWNNSNYNFNFAFGLAGYNYKQDVLGTMLNVLSKNNFNFNVYGIDSKFSNFIDLKNNKNENLYKKIDSNQNEKNNIYNIVINQTIAKKLNLNVGFTYNFSFLNKSLKSYDSTISLVKKNEPSFDYDSDIFTKDHDLRSYKYSKLKYNDNGNYNKPYDTDPFGTKPTESKEYISNGKWHIDSESKNINFKVVGITKFYGQPVAYINNNDANKILKYDKSQDFFVNQFMKEWKNTDVIKFKSLNKEIKNYKQLVENTKQSTLTFFNNEYPIFNYKLSKSNNLFDLKDAVQTSNLYGDYTAYGLNGGTYVNDKNKKTKYIGQGISSINYLLSKDMFLSLYDNLNKIPTICLSIFFFLLISISFIIILLTSSIVFDENSKSILTMKTLGYNSRFVVKTFFSFYFPIVLFFALIGTFTSIGLIIPIINLINKTHNFYIPLNISWYIPFIIVLAFILLVYFFSLVANFIKIKKFNINDIFKLRNF